ncbi:winged helix-turn-helix domain-containing protein [Natrinema ejinorense]|nr:helix-turn-helix domain-containing protein [Natrinema ejinorense]
MTDTDDVTAELDFKTLAEVLDDDYARDVLRATSRTPMTVQELRDVSEASPSTLYRRVERLQRVGLLERQTRPRRDGHHDTVYAANLSGIHITLDDGHFEFELDRPSEDVADRLQQLWSDF